MNKKKAPKSEGKGARSDKFKFQGFGPRLSLRDQALFAKRLSLLIKADVPLLEAINILKRSITNPANKKMMESIAHDVANGQYLSKSMFKYKKVFGDFAVNIIRVGETSGTLADNLKYLSEEIDKSRELKGKVVGALIYPAIILVAALAISGLLTLFLFPKLLPIFQSLHANLPFTTRALIWLSTFLLHYGLWVIFGLSFLVAGFIFALSYENIRYYWDALILKLPVIGSLFKNYHLTSMCRTLGLLLRGGVRVLEATAVASETATNLIYRRELDNLQKDVSKGLTIARHLEHRPKLFPPMFTEMIAIGEATGNLSDTLVYLAEISEQELDETAKRFSSIIEPAMMIVMGLLVG
ncbi:MAG: type II secretion system F family protein, partial [bacterium]|nr:type II secretion system F family protein [bacterium]